MSSRTTAKANEPRRAERFCLTERRGASPHLTCILYAYVVYLGGLGQLVIP